MNKFKKIVLHILITVGDYVAVIYDYVWWVGHVRSRKLKNRCSINFLVTQREEQICMAGQGGEGLDTNEWYIYKIPIPTCTSDDTLPRL